MLRRITPCRPTLVSRAVVSLVAGAALEWRQALAPQAAFTVTVKPWDLKIMPMGLPGTVAERVLAT